jgi:hypothetical protein
MNTNLERSLADGPVSEPTLAEVLTRTVRTAVPTWLCQLLHLALPLAVDFAFRGWWRPAAAALAVTAFGAWGLADRWLWGAAQDEEPQVWPTRLVRVGRAVTGTVSAIVGALLALELFLRLLGSAPIS